MTKAQVWTARNGEAHWEVTEYDVGAVDNGDGPVEVWEAEGGSRWNDEDPKCPIVRHGRTLMNIALQLVRWYEGVDVVEVEHTEYPVADFLRLSMAAPVHVTR